MHLILYEHRERMRRFRGVMISDYQALEPLSKADSDIDLEQSRWTLQTLWDLYLTLKNIET